MNELLHAHNLTRVFQSGNNKVYALNNVDISMNSGEFTILNGRSGSGKTTLINLLGALDHPTQGKIILQDKDITKMSEKERELLRRKSIGFIFQSVALMSLMTAYENVELSLRIAGYGEKKRRERTMECLSLVGLEKKMKHKPTELSGGEQQRIAIARAIAHRPSIIFADEPTAELDSHTGLSIVKTFKNLIKNEGMTIVMTTHDPEMMNIADKVYTLQDGEVVNE